MGQLFSNNGKTTLASPVDTITTSIVVIDASVFPVITGSDTFKVTLESSNRLVVEIVEVTAVVGNVLTVVRGREGTVASSFDAGSFVEGRLTAGWLNDTGTKLGTVSATELGYLNGVTSGVQGQIDGKEPTITTLPVSKGGTGVSALTGLVKGNGTSAMTAAVAGTDYVVPSGSITGNAATATILQTARTINGVSFNGSANITIADSTKIPTTEKGAANGVATLDANGKVPSAQLPSYVDDVLEFTNLAGFPATGESGKIYVALDTNKTYRWSGTAYIYITSGAVDTVAGKTGVVTLVKADVGLANVDNTSDANKPISTATQTALNTKLASTSYTASDVLAKIKTVDGSGSELDADLLDGQQGSWYAPLASPAFTGTPTAPTAAVGTNTTQLATTAYVSAEIANDAVTKTSNTGAAALPAGTVAQRPTGQNGLIRYNKDLDQFEGFKSGSWGSLSPTYGFKNHIINGNFDIWQRGTSQTSDGYRSDDRWANYNIGSDKTHSQVACTDTERVLFNASAFSRTVVNSAAGAYRAAGKAQSIEDVTRLAGKTVTLSFWAKADSSKNIAVEFTQRFGTGGSPSVTGIGSQLVSLTTAWQKKTITVTLPSIVGKTLGTDGAHTTSTSILFWFDAGSDFNARTANLGQQSGTFDIAQVQLEEGSVATPFEQRPYGLELSLCQRYYETGRVLPNFVFPSTSQYISRVVEFKVQKRVIPSIAISTDGVTGKVRVSDAPAYSTDIVVQVDYNHLSVSERGDTGVSRSFVEFNYTASAEL